MDIAIVVVALAMVGYHIAYAFLPFLDPVLHSHTHLAFALIIIFLVNFAENKKKFSRGALVTLVLMSLFGASYIYIFYEDLLLRSWFSSPVDLVMGLVLIVVTLEATRRTFGLLIPALAIVFVIYPFIGSHLGGPFYATSYPVGITLSNLSVSMTGGLYGTPLYSSATFVFLFVVFGGALQASGANRFFLQLGRLAGNILGGGPAMMAVVSSALVGSVTGSALANVAITGSFTIPLMKKCGYRPEEAGAIEAAASNGGQIMPPIMGITAFVMAGVTGIPYLTIVSMAWIPAILYFGSIGVYVQLRAKKSGLSTPVDKVEVREVLFSAPIFIIPLGVIIILLLKGYSVMYIASCGIASIIVTSVAMAAIEGKGRSPFWGIIKGIAKGAKDGAGIAAITGAMGLITTTFTMSGLGVKLSSGIEIWSGGNLFIAMIIVAVVCTIMGCGGVAVAAYLIVSMFAAPAMIKMGVPLAHAHFFVMFPSAFALLTPPIALAALVGARMAGASYQRTAFQACQAGFSGFILPFMFIYAPILLLSPSGLYESITGIAASVLLLLAMQFAFAGFCLVICSGLERILWILSSAALFIYLPMRIDLIFATGAFLFVLLTIWQFKRRLVTKRAGLSSVE